MAPGPPEWSKLTGTSPFLFTGTVRVATDPVPLGQRVPETLPVLRSTGGEEEEESEVVCHFSEYEAHSEGSPAESEEAGTRSEEDESVLEVTPQLDSGGTTPIKPTAGQFQSQIYERAARAPRGGSRREPSRRPGTPRSGKLW